MRDTFTTFGKHQSARFEAVEDRAAALELRAQELEKALEGERARVSALGQQRVEVEDRLSKLEKKFEERGASGPGSTSQASVPATGIT